MTVVVQASHELSLPDGSRQVPGLRHNLVRQFLLVASGVLLLGMLTMGTWVTRRIESGVTEVAAASAALYINNFIAPHLQELAWSASLSAPNIEALNRAMARPAVRDHVTAIKIWKQDGLIVYSTDKDLIGRKFPLNPSPRRAWSGTVATDFNNLSYEEDAKDRASGLHLLEIFTPIRNAESGDVIAVLEFHERAEILNSQLDNAQWQSWVITALITLAMMGAMFSIVADGSKTIDQQRVALTQRISQLSELLHQNRSLRARVERAARNATEDNERLMRRVGYDLHDGIAQLIGLALLRLDRVRGTKRDIDNLGKIQKALRDALTDIRNVCRGLLLPEIQDLTLREALLFMVRHHERRTGTAVTCDISDLPDDVPQFVKISLCRFVQEGLNNAFKHAGGKGQRVCASCADEIITVEVADEGPGMSITDRASHDVRLGLTGLSDRIESTGGTLTVKSAPGVGTRLAACLPLITGGLDEK